MALFKKKSKQNEEEMIAKATQAYNEMDKNDPYFNTSYYVAYNNEKANTWERHDRYRCITYKNHYWRYFKEPVTLDKVEYSIGFYDESGKHYDLLVTQEELNEKKDYIIRRCPHCGSIINIAYNKGYENYKCPECNHELTIAMDEETKPDKNPYQKEKANGIGHIVLWLLIALIFAIGTFAWTQFDSNREYWLQYIQNLTNKMPQ